MNLPNQLPPLPVTVITGFLGAGKTTLINHLLRSLPDRRIGVLVNDFGDVSIDADLIVAQTEDVLTLANGCICCSLRGDLTRTVMTLAESMDRPEHLLIEASGISYPETILSAMLELERYQIVRLDGVLGVVDASEDDQLSKEPAHLAQSQKRAADILFVSKLDLLPPETIKERVQSLRKIYPKVLEGNYPKLPAELLLGLEGPLERQLEQNEHAQLPSPNLSNPHEHQIKWLSHRFTTTAPLSFKKLVAELKQLPIDIYRAKGFLHIVERPTKRLLLHLTGRRVQIRTIGEWSGPPRSELLFIGTEDGFEVPALEERLNHCLEHQSSEEAVVETLPEEVSWVRYRKEPVN